MLDSKIINCHIFTDEEEYFADIGIENGKIKELGKNLSESKKIIDAHNKIVLPGGVDTHCHLDQHTGNSSKMADNFKSGTKSAICGGTTTIISFALQEKGECLTSAILDYHEKANYNAYCDYSFHIIITDLNKGKTLDEIPGLINRGYSSFKMYMTYEELKLNDFDIIRLLDCISRNRGFALIHAENDECILWLTNTLLSQGFKNPYYHAESRPEYIESEAVNRAATLCRLVNAQMLIVHVSSKEAFKIIAEAKANNIKIFAETCPQYLFLSTENLCSKDIKESAKYVCSPPPRSVDNQKFVWNNIKNGNVDIFSSDHAPYCNNSSGKFFKSNTPNFNEIPNGIPGIETRMSLLLSEVLTNEFINIKDFVRITSVNPAKLFGLYPQKGTISIGSDADIVIWKEADIIIKNKNLHHNVDYTPYEGRKVSVWPEMVFVNGHILYNNGFLNPHVCTGKFIPRSPR
ncbi:dihydropyrimidinase [Acidithiobacillus thiooxidans]|uniref:Dihydropyrimidinase n=1 Tax=Acidithiobacillus sulfurivorans TaxID=1958756 RepID=A0ABS6A202_9PROT|nr:MULTISPECIES: dihydropyrimidinase [Acidithiobacillus]MBU2761542.1 dihydropyrimidinase [Acidithiobacillus sulfurivorans]MBU2837886.1 dihydropyrimidinase [Acidithiobacillus thiooxidans]